MKITAGYLNLPAKDTQGTNGKNNDSSSANDNEDSESISGEDDSHSFGGGERRIGKDGRVEFDGAEILHASGFNLGNYTSEDMASLTQITQEMNRRMEMARGMKRGRKVQGFAEYCQKTTERINDLKNTLKNEKTSEDKKK